MCASGVCTVQQDNASQYLRTLVAETEALHYEAKGIKYH